MLIQLKNGLKKNIRFVKQLLEKVVQNNYFLGLILLLVTIIIIRKLVVKFSIGSVVPAILFDLNLMSYFWGGMGIFGARIWFFLLPVLTLLILRFTIRRFSNIVDK